jgi:tetratricopeptide (TPR) repeat protein
LRARICLDLLRATTGNISAEIRERALVAIQEALALREDAGLRVELVRLYLHRGEVDAAASALEKLVRPPVTEVLEIARLFAERGAMADARRHVARLPSFDALPHAELAQVASLHLMVGDARQAVTAFERAAAMAPNEDAYTLGLADARIAAGDVTTGLNLLHRRAERADREQAEAAWLDIAVRLRKRRDISGELSVLKEAMAAVGTRPAFLARLGELAEAQGRHDEAVQHWSRLCADFPLSPEAARPVALRAAISVAIARQDEAAAAPLYARLLLVQPDDADALLALARLDAAGRRVAAAEAGYRRYLAIRDGDARAWYELGRLLVADGREARRELGEALRHLPAEALSTDLAVAADCHRLLGRTDEAVRLYQRAMMRGADARMIADYATLLIALRRLEQAGMAVTEARSRWPRDERLARIAATIHLALDAPREALGVLREIVPTGGDDNAMLAELAAAARGTGAWTEAMRSYAPASSRGK